MRVRSLELLDVPEVLRWRDEVLGLDTVRLLTRGNPLGTSGLLTHLQPLRRVYSVIAEGRPPLFGGIYVGSDAALAHLLYLAPLTALDHPALPLLLEALLQKALEWGALYVLAEVDEGHSLLEPLRRLHFVTNLWQRIWLLTEVTEANAIPWSRAGKAQFPTLSSLYQQLVPPLLHPIEAPGKRNQLTYMAGEMAFALVNKGVQGVVVTPLFHPDLDDPGRALRGLVGFLRQRFARPLYLRLPGYQSWLEEVLREIGAVPGARQALLVHHLGRLQLSEERLSATSRQVVGAT